MRTPITVSGNLASDPTLRYFPDGRAVVTLSVADNNGYRNKSGEYVEQDPVFHRCEVTGELAENIAESLHKGDAVVLRGDVVASNYVPKPTEQKPNPEKVYGQRVEVVDVGASLRRARVKVARVMREEPIGEPGGGAGSGRRAASSSSQTGLHTGTTGEPDKTGSFAF